MQQSLSNAKAETVDFLLEKLDAQQEQIRQQQNTIDELRVTCDQQQLTICSLQTKLVPFSTSVSPSSSLSSQSENTSLQTNFYVRECGSTTGRNKSSEDVGLGVSERGLGRVCSGACGKLVVKAGYSKPQWKRHAQDGLGKCLSCTRVKPKHSAVPARVTVAMSTASLSADFSACGPKISLPSDASPEPTVAAVVAGLGELSGAVDG